MNSIVRPRRTVLFSQRPKGQVQADLLDDQLHNLIEAINSTQLALADIRRDDGKLRTGSVGNDQLAVEIKHTRAEMDTIEARVVEIASNVTAAAGQVAQIAREIHLRALDAEKAAAATLGAVSQTNHNLKSTFDDASDAENSADRSEAAAIQSQNSANYSHANADNAIAAKNEATQWAEYLAGPVVNPNDAPAYIQNHPFGHGLYYQPVEGGLAGLWSAKWWALYAQQLVGHWNFYYLGAWPTPPMPGEANPGTGLVTPDPLAPGSFYYNTETGSLYIWDGTQWTTPIKLTPAYQANYVYVATAGQTVFSGPDANSNIPLVTKNDSDVHLNGIRLVGGIDYTVDKPTSTLTLAVGATANSIVQWDILVESSQLAPGAISVFKLIITPTPDGTNKIFDMHYNNPTMGNLPIASSQVAEVAISIDGIVQEPAVDFTATGHTLTMANAPPAGCRFWGTWHASDLILP
jgi:hypothetical protein